MVVKKRRRAPETPLEKANRESDEDFVAHYLRPGCPNSSPWTTAWSHPGTNQPYTISLVRAQSLTKVDFEACFKLIEDSSRADYEASTKKWRPAEKRAEMKSPGLRYILVRNDSGAVCAFTSFMPTYEEGQPVIYCYEIHLMPEMQRTGLGSLLLGYHSTMAFNMPIVRKVMLTCFVSNVGAMKFYLKMGFDKDEISPVSRTLRNGRVVVPDYAILSKTIRSVDVLKTAEDDEAT